MTTLLKVNNLKTHFFTHTGVVKAVDGVSFHIDESEIVAVVGESGCGKSVSQLSIMQLVSTPPGKIVDGTVEFEGRDILRLDPKGKEMRGIRGGKISMIFQEPMTSLNPLLTIHRQLTEAMEVHLDLDRSQIHDRAIELLDMVGISDTDKRIHDYPHQFSGGMRQRIMIAMALSCNPRIIIADEPTTALDVTTQAQLLELMSDLVSKFKASLIIVTHNLGIVARYARRIYVMYAGRVIESGTAKEIFGSPKHPYTRGLLNCVPRLDTKDETRLVPIAGSIPNLVNMKPNCAFYSRCQHRVEECKREYWPVLRHITGLHHVSCHAC